MKIYYLCYTYADKSGECYTSITRCKICQVCQVLVSILEKSILVY